MKKLSIAATGYYGSTESWKWVKDSYEMIADALAKMVHKSEPVIIAGVKVSGNQVSDGFISYKGELFYFQGGAKTDTVVIIEDITEQEYNTNPSGGGQLPVYPTYINRYAKCGQPGEGVDEFNFDDLTILSQLIDISERTKPATEDKAGIVEIATQAEVDAGTDDSRAVTPLKLKHKLENQPYRIIKNFKVNSAGVNVGDIYSNHETFLLGSNIGESNYMVVATYNDQSVTSAQPILFTGYTQKADDRFIFNWVLDARALTGRGTISGWIDIVVIYIGG